MSNWSTMISGVATMVFGYCLGITGFVLCAWAFDNHRPWLFILGIALTLTGPVFVAIGWHASLKEEL